MLDISEMQLVEIVTSRSGLRQKNLEIVINQEKNNKVSPSCAAFYKHKNKNKNLCNFLAAEKVNDDNVKKTNKQLNQG